MRIDVRSPRTSYGLLAAIGVALALALCVWAAGAPRGAGRTALGVECPLAEGGEGRYDGDQRGAGDGDRRVRARARGRARRATPRGAQVGRARPPAAPEQPEGSPFVGGRNALAAPGPPSQVGEWTQAPFQLPTFAINTTVLPTGKVLIWGRPPATGRRQSATERGPGGPVVAVARDRSATRSSKSRRR